MRGGPTRQRPTTLLKASRAQAAQPLPRAPSPRACPPTPHKPPQPGARHPRRPAASPPALLLYHHTTTLLCHPLPSVPPTTLCAARPDPACPPAPTWPPRQTPQTPPAGRSAGRRQTRCSCLRGGAGQGGAPPRERLERSAASAAFWEAVHCAAGMGEASASAGPACARRSPQKCSSA